MKTSDSGLKKGPLEVAKQGSITVPIYSTSNRIYRLNPATGNRELKCEQPQFTVIYCEGLRRVKRKFSDLANRHSKTSPASWSRTSARA